MPQTQADTLSNAVRVETLTEQVYNGLLDAIILGEIQPGERLKLEDLAARLGVSLTPLRGALARLQAEGIVSGEPRRGLRVVTLDSQQMNDIFEARLMCEAFAAEKAAPSITEVQLGRMRELIEEYAAIAGRDAPAERRTWVSREIEFHSFIVDLAGNERISAWFRALGVHIQSIILLRPSRWRDQVSVREHQAIYEAFAALDAGRARAAVMEHIQAARDFTLKSMTDLRWETPSP